MLGQLLPGYYVRLKKNSFRCHGVFQLVNHKIFVLKINIFTGVSFIEFQVVHDVDRLVRLILEVNLNSGRK
jgi:hypothetical protein